MNNNNLPLPLDIIILLIIGESTRPLPISTVIKHIDRVLTKNAMTVSSIYRIYARLEKTQLLTTVLLPVSKTRGHKVIKHHSITQSGHDKIQNYSSIMVDLLTKYLIREE